MNEDVTTLLAEHCVDWESRNTLQTFRGVDATESIFTLLPCLANHHMEDDPRTLRDFSLIHIDPVWIHHEEGDALIPIMRMSQRQIMDTIEGVDWHVFSDVFFRDRTPEWWTQVIQLYYILFCRCAYFATHELQPSILDIEEYTTRRTVNFLEDGLASDSHAQQERLDGYRSDDEEDAGKGRKRIKHRRTAKRQKQIGPELEALEAKRKKNMEVVIAHVSPPWLVDIDSMFTFFWREALIHETHPEPMEAPRQDLAYIRTWLCDEIDKIDKTESVRFRRVWFDDLIVTDCHKRMYLRKMPFNPRPASREVIINKQDALHLVHCETFKSIMEKRVDDDVNTYYRMSTDAMLFRIAKSFGIHDGDPCVAVFRKNIRAVEGPLCIYRDPIRGRWIVYMSFSERYMIDSFTAGFWYMRQLMIERNMSPKKGTTTLSVMDAHFKPPTSS